VVALAIKRIPTTIKSIPDIPTNEVFSWIKIIPNAVDKTMLAPKTIGEITDTSPPF
jgi:hypothetical protein